MLSDTLWGFFSTLFIILFFSLSISNAAFNEETDSTPTSPYTGSHQPVSAPADSSPGWAANSWAHEWVFVISFLFMLSCSSIYLICLFPLLFNIINPSSVYNTYPFIDSVLNANITNKNLFDENENDENNKFNIKKNIR